MGRPRRSAALPTRDRILLAAEAELGRVGIAAARLEDIAAAAGIKKPSLLYHFESKDLLYEAVLLRVFAALEERFVAEVQAPGPFEERFCRLVAAFEAFTAERPAFASMVLHEVLAPNRPEVLGPAAAAVLVWWESWLRQEGGAALRPEVDLRAALLTLATSAMVRASAGPLRAALWGPTPPLVPMARAMLLAESASARG